MARERKGFIVVQVWATIRYTDAHGKPEKISKLVKLSDSQKKLNEAQKQKQRVKQGGQVNRETIAELQRNGATNCKAQAEKSFQGNLAYQGRPTR